MPLRLNWKAPSLTGFALQPQDAELAILGFLCFYLYVAPGAKTSDANRSFTADAAQFLLTAQTIAIRQNRLPFEAYSAKS
jgi:hypothetical protein